MSEGTDLSTDIIYVRLLDEGTDVWRPVLGTHISGDVYVIHKTGDYDPDVESWEFAPESRVRCKVETRHGRQLLLAVAASD